MSAEAVANLFVFAMVIPATLFPLLYGFGSPSWRQSHVGRALMAHGVGMLLLVDLSAAYQLFGGEYPYHEWVDLAVLLILVVGLWYQLFALVRIRQQAKANR